MLKTKAELRPFDVCPNCGLILSSEKFTQTPPIFTQNSHMIVEGRFNCPVCNYSGPPISMNSIEYDEAIFEKKKFDQLANKPNPYYVRLFLLCILLLVLSVLLPVQIQFFATLIIFLIMAVAFWKSFKKDH